MIDRVTRGRVSENRDSPVRLRSSFTERLSSEANSSANNIIPLQQTFLVH